MMNLTFVGWLLEKSFSDQYSDYDGSVSNDIDYGGSEFKEVNYSGSEVSEVNYSGSQECQHYSGLQRF